MDNNLSMIKELLVTENTLCFSSVNNKQTKFINCRNNFILNNKDYEGKLNFLEYYNTDKIMKKLLMEESILLLEEFFLKTYAKKVLNYIRKWKIFKKNAVPTVNKSGMNTKKIKKDIQKIVIRKSKNIEKAVKNVDESSLKKQFKEISMEVTEYLNKMVGSFRKDYMTHAIIQYTLLLSLGYLCTAVLEAIFITIFGSVMVTTTAHAIRPSSHKPFLISFFGKSLGEIFKSYKTFMSAPALSRIITSILIIPFIEEEIKSDEIKIGKGSEFILVVSIGELIKKTLFYPFGYITNLLLGIFKVIATVTTGFIHYYYNKKGKTGLGKIVAMIVNALGSIAIGITTTSVPTNIINSIIGKKT